MTAASEVNGREGHLLEMETTGDQGTVAATHGIGGGKAGTRVEAWAVVVIILAMILLPTLESIVRRFTGNGLPGSAVYTQHLTLWVGFIGALLATAAEKHLALSTIDMLPAGRPRTAALAYGHFVSAAVSALLAYASIKMVLAEVHLCGRRRHP